MESSTKTRIINKVSEWRVKRMRGVNTIPLYFDAQFWNSE